MDRNNVKKKPNNTDSLSELFLRYLLLELKISAVYMVYFI